ncbi:MAG: hypothetical protein WAL34_25420 [Acidobacteriaceae bacterium]
MLTPSGVILWRLIPVPPPGREATSCEHSRKDRNFPVFLVWRCPSLDCLSRSLQDLITLVPGLRSRETTMVPGIGMVGGTAVHALLDRLVCAVPAP